ncbi:ABC transporter substrate-binding protein [Rhodococcus artemisiae]|uniref:ABC transporter substrate-binding protein n=1 Tax=Rhodococcus artemisiae TaxID=714159 RepID=A0ABU7LKA4_9NOCA|nr:ABC transporter substrate-binding protein [Rhodococcus artemisiae]MEE2062000.1 ABC transporter substrate-binding protein [Rhodococcus artemisiae]
MSRSRIAIAVAGVGAAMVALTACGGTESNVTEDGLTTVTVGNMNSNSLTFPLLVAQEEGFFADAGLHVETVDAVSGPELTAALIGGTTQIAVGTPENVMPAMAQGQGLVAIPPFGQLDMSLITLQDSGINEVADLVGKQVGVVQRGSFSEKFARSIMVDHGLDPDSVTYIAVGAGATMEPALRNGKVDASVGATSTVALLDQHGLAIRNLANSLDETGGEAGEFGMQTMWTTTVDYREQNPEIAEGFCSAMNRASDWIADDANRGAGVQLMSTLLAVPQETAETIWDRTHLSWKYRIDDEKWNRVADWVLEDNETGLPYADYVSADCGEKQ